MTGKRSWNVVRRELRLAASGKKTKGKMLSDYLLVPETFNVEQKTDIQSRQHAEISKLIVSPNERMILLAEYKEIETQRFGSAMIVKHLPQMKFFMNEKFETHLRKKFAQTMELAALNHDHILVVGTISCNPQGVFHLEAACLLNLNKHWIPYETNYEYQLLEKLHSENRRYLKGLRYNLNSSKGLASAVLIDTGSESTALFIKTQENAEDTEAIAERMANDKSMKVWIWNSSEAIPALPSTG